MATKAATPNRFKEYHRFLLDKDPDELKQKIEEICIALGISERTYYRKLEAPESLSPAEKTAIALKLALPVHFIFPDME